MSHVKVSFEMPEYTASTDAVGTIRLLEAIRAAKLDCRFYQASTSEMFGATPPPQNESTVFYPRSPYGAAKLYSHWVTINYREAYDMFAVLRHPVQPRVAPSRRDLRDPQDHPRRRADQGRACRTSSTSATSTRSATGATPRSTSRACGGCFSTTSPTDFVLATGTGTTVREFIQYSSRTPVSTGRSTCVTTSATNGPTEVDALIGDPAKAGSSRLEGQDPCQGAGRADGRRRHRAAGRPAASTA